MSLSTKISPTELRQQVLEEIAELCVSGGMHHLIISPGSRSAPLTLAFSRHPQLDCRVVYDERAAAYIGLGLAQQTGRPVGLVCTSGTAALNYAPAVTEAFYQQIPLLVFTADRPPEWIDQQDNQSIHQYRLYEPHCRGSFELSVDMGDADARWHARRLLSEALNRAKGLTPGPVHINVPLREPLYTQSAHHAQESTRKPKATVAPPTSPRLDESSWPDLLEMWHAAQRKLVIIGTHHPDPRLNSALSQLSNDSTVAVIGDITANIYPSGTDIYHSDMILGTHDGTMRQLLSPDLVITCGGPLVSKYMKLFLRQYPPRSQWHIQPEGDAPDTYQCLSHVIHMRPAEFFTELAQRATQEPQIKEANSYRATWHQLENRAAHALSTFLDGATFGEFVAVQRVMNALPAGSRLQLGNSMPIRYANLIGPRTDVELAAVHANRGTSGIDGTVSTAVGAALANDTLTTLIVGDLAFFYDRNGLWHEHLPSNLRIIVLNNHGGGIFDLIAGPDQLDSAERRTYFMTPQPLSARRTAADHGCDYFHCQDNATLQSLLAKFFAPRQRPAILEIESEMEVNGRVFQQFKRLVNSQL